jgi:hypothetical protein
MKEPEVPFGAPMRSVPLALSGDSPLHSF